MKALIQILACCLIITQLHAAQHPTVPPGTGILVDLYEENFDNTNSDNTHTFAISAYDVRYRLELVSSVPGTTSTTRTYNLYVESPTGEPVSAHGLTCSIDFGNLIINNMSADVSASSLNPDEDAQVFHASQSKLDVALSRADKDDVIIDDVLITVIIISDNVTSACPFTAFISNGTMSSGNDEVSINDALFYGTPNGSIVSENLSIAATSGGTYEADYALNSDATIQSGNAVEFKAGEVIELGIGFSVEAGAEFSSQIQNCGGE